MYGTSYVKKSVCYLLNHSYGVKSCLSVRPQVNSRHVLLPPCYDIDSMFTRSGEFLNVFIFKLFQLCCVVHQKRLDNVEYLNCVCSRMPNDARCTLE